MKKLLTLVILAVAVPAAVLGQGFGKNRVNYKNFDWKYLQTEHFDIYFTEGGRDAAEFTAETAEDSYRSLRADFRFDLTDRISVIVYKSHNDFEQTNVQIAPPEESVGGFTEFFKNRVVIPYEGDWEKFRHVIHHELTHAVMLQMVYGSGVQSIITGLTRLQLPLWFIEGLAEYESRGWDTESDMFMRDAALNNYAPSIDYLYGFLAYKGGQSVWMYLAEKYGGPKVGEILGKVKVTKSLDRGLRQSIGVGIKDLSERWQRHLKRVYWPDLADRQEPEEIAKRLTDHRKDRNFINNSPALSPKGDRIAFLSDKSDYFDIYVMSTVDPKHVTRVVSGQQSGSLEELHWLRPRISWSPDGQFLTFASKAGDQDALHIVDVRAKKVIESRKVGLDGIFGPDWSPLGDEIAFMGTKNGQGDLYAYNVNTKKMRKITDDVFTDHSPSWSPDGSQIVFISDRGRHLDASILPDNFDIASFPYRNRDIYIINADGTGLRQVTDTEALEGWPVFSPDGQHLAYTSDVSGISNIYIHDLASNQNYPITNLVTGAFQISWRGDASRLAFVSFYNAGYDIYIMRNPLDTEPGSIALKETRFVAQREAGELPRPTEAIAHERKQAETAEDSSGQAFSTYVFGKEFRKGEVEEAKTETVFLDTSEYKAASGEYRVRDYTVKFTPDIIYGNAGYSQFWGVQGTTQLALSDVLGNHRMNLYTNLFYDLRNSNFQFEYYYLPRRTDVGIGGFHYAYFFLTGGRYLVRDRNWGGSLFLSRPLSRYNRFDFGVTFLAVDRDYLDFPDAPTFKRRVLLNHLAYTKDTTIWGYTGPENGMRSMISVLYSPRMGDNGLDFYTVRGDWRRYYKFNKEYNFSVRFAGAASGGLHKQRFFVGGVDNWLNYRTKGDGIRVDNIDDIYFSTFETPLRGGDYYELEGDRFLMTNFEFRFPLVRYLLMGWPLPLGLQNIRGAAFADLAGAWFDDLSSFNPTTRDEAGNPQFDDAFLGTGFGARIGLGFFLLRIDMAWKTGLDRSFSKPRYYFSLGADF